MEGYEEQEVALDISGSDFDGRLSLHSFIVNFSLSI